ncbi:MAG TPA: LuxR C-terminal-related transcriptional regulator [Vicinamibacterales bacterium]|nr:LuxR C-terminal-related transcriptional regulator [Vicinamibacterales bacterium]
MSFPLRLSSAQAADAVGINVASIVEANMSRWTDRVRTPDYWHIAKEDLVLQISPWERAVLQLLADGAEIDDIAVRFDMSDGDVEEQLSTLFARMGVRNRQEASVDALRRGLLPTPSSTKEMWSDDPRRASR